MKKYILVGLFFIATFFKLRPCKCWHISKLSFDAVRATKEGLISVTVWPSFLAISYPSPVEPVNG